MISIGNLSYSNGLHGKIQALGHKVRTNLGPQNGLLENCYLQIYYINMIPHLFGFWGPQRVLFEKTPVFSNNMLELIFTTL